MGAQLDPFTLFQRLTVVVALLLLVGLGWAGLGPAMLTAGLGLLVLLAKRILDAIEKLSEDTRRYHELVAALSVNEDQKPDASA